MPTYQKAESSQDDYPNRRAQENIRNCCLDRLIPLVEWPRYHDYPSVSGWRWMLHTKGNDLAFQRCIKRISKNRILVDESEWFSYVRSVAEQ